MKRGDVYELRIPMTYEDFLTELPENAHAEWVNDETVLLRDETGHFQVVKPNDEGIYHSSVLTNFWLNVNWLWTKPQPSTPAVIAQIVGPDALSQL